MTEELRNEAQDNDPTDDQNEEQDSAEDLSELWAQVAPDVGDSYKELTAESQVKLALQLAAQLRKERATGDAPTDAVKAATPSVQPLPDVDREKIVSAFRVAIDNGDVDALADLLVENNTRVLNGMTLVDRVLRQHEETLMPVQLADILDRVPGAERGDVREAVRLIKSGEVTSPQTALELAALRRARQTTPPRRKDADESARRKAQAIIANALGSDGTIKGDTPRKIPQNAQEEIAFLMAEEEARAK